MLPFFASAKPLFSNKVTFFFFNLLAAARGMWDLIPPPGIKPVPTAVEAQS